MVLQLNMGVQQIGGQKAKPSLCREKLGRQNCRLYLFFIHYFCNVCFLARDWTSNWAGNELLFLEPVGLWPVGLCSFACGVLLGCFRFCEVGKRFVLVQEHRPAKPTERMKRLSLQTLFHSWVGLGDSVGRWISIINMSCVHKWLWEQALVLWSFRTSAWGESHRLLPLPALHITL